MQDDPIEILKRRLTLGEITINEFNELSAALISKLDQSRDTKHREHFSSFRDKQIITINTNNWFGNETFCHKGSVYDYTEIQALESVQSTQTINFMPMHDSGFVITLLNGKVLRYVASSVFRRTRKVKYLSDAFVFISRKTFKQRLSRYLNEFNHKGYFQYHGYFIYGNGDIKYKARTVNIADAGLQNGVQIGRESSFGLHSYYTPDEIWIYQKIPGKFLKQRIGVKIKEDRDIIYAILIKLAESKGGRVEFVKP